MTSKVRVPSTMLVLGGWKGTLDIDGDVLRVVAEDLSKRLDIDGAQIKRYSFNNNNGLSAAGLCPRPAWPGNGPGLGQRA